MASPSTRSGGKRGKSSEPRCMWCGKTGAVLSRRLTGKTSVPIGCEACIAEKAPSLLLLGLVGPEQTATADLLSLGGALKPAGNKPSMCESASDIEVKAGSSRR